MKRAAAGPGLVLTGAGVLLLLVGAAGIFAGLALAERIHALLPEEITSDAAAIGGAALALGVAAIGVGVVHLALGLGLRLLRPGLTTMAIVLCAVMAALAIGWAVAALVSAAAGSAPAEGMVPAGIGLLLVAAAYGWAAAVLMRLRRRS